MCATTNHSRRAKQGAGVPKNELARLLLRSKGFRQRKRVILNLPHSKHLMPPSELASNCRRTPVLHIRLGTSQDRHLRLQAHTAQKGTEKCSETDHHPLYKPCQPMAGI